MFACLRFDGLPRLEQCNCRLKRLVKEGAGSPGVVVICLIFDQHSGLSRVRSFVACNGLDKKKDRSSQRMKKPVFMFVLRLGETSSIFTYEHSITIYSVKGETIYKKGKDIGMKNKFKREQPYEHFKAIC